MFLVQLPGTNPSEQWPLCSHYSAVNFEASEVRATADDGAATQLASFVWALGRAANGEHEVLGVWPVADTKAVPWRWIGSELALRGVTSIRHISGDAWKANRPMSVEDALPHVASGGSAWKAGVPLSVVAREQEVVRKLAKALKATVARQQDFQNREAARVFVLGALKRASTSLGRVNQTRNASAILRSAESARP